VKKSILTMPQAMQQRLLKNIKLQENNFIFG
jgi:hypothetical protein